MMESIQEDWLEDKYRKCGGDTMAKTHGSSEVNKKDNAELPSTGCALLKHMFLTFADGVSIVGFKYVFMQGANIIRRLVWLTFVLGGLAFMVYQIQNQIQEYLQFKTTVQMKIAYHDSIVFPTVTICNENRYKRSMLEKMGKCSKI